MITLGTGKEVEKAKGLVRLHAYGVGEMSLDEKGRRRVEIENPWSKGRKEAEGRDRAWTRGLLQALEEEEAPRGSCICRSETRSFNADQLRFPPALFFSLSHSNHVMG